MAEELTQAATPEVPSIDLSPKNQEKKDYVADAKAAFNSYFAELYKENATIFQVGEDVINNLHCPTIVNVTAKNEGVIRNYLDEASGMAVAQSLFDRGIEDPRVAYYSNTNHHLSIKDHQVAVEKEKEDGTKETVYEDAPIYLKEGSKGMSISKVPLITRDYKYSPKDPAKEGKDIRVLEENCFNLVPVSAIDTDAFDHPFEIDPDKDFANSAFQQDMDTIFRAAVKKTGEILAEAKEQGREITDFWAEMGKGFDEARRDFEIARNEKEEFLYNYDVDKEITTDEERIQRTIAKEFQAAVEDAKDNDHDISRHYAIDAVCKIIANPKLDIPDEKISKVMQEYAPGAVNNRGYGQWVVKQARKEMAISRAIHKKERAEKEKAAAVR